MARFRSWLDEERQKIAALPGREKAAYIWQYYKIWIAGIAAIVFLASYLAVRIHNNIPGCYLYVVFANTREEAANGSGIWRDFASYAQYDLTEKRLEFDDACYFDYLKNQARGNRYYDAFIALTDAGVLDVVAMESASLSALGQSGRLLSLDAPLCRDLREKYADRLVYYTPEEGESIPVGIDVSDSLLVTRYHLYAQSCALGLGTETQNIDNVETFLCFILEEMPDAGVD